MVTHRTICGIGLLLIVPTGFSGGCHPAPKTFSTSEFADPQTRAQAAELYWSRMHTPDLHQGDGRRVAVVEFGVQFVTQKMRGLFESQPVASAPIGFVGLGIAALGVERSNVSFPPELQAALPDEIYELFCQELESRGFQVLAPHEVRAADSYAHLETAAFQASDLAQYLNFIATDTGRIKAYETFAARHTPLIARHSNKKEVETVLDNMIGELGTDLVLRVIIRVGVYLGHAAVEYGSRIDVITAEQRGRIEARRTLLSDDEVLASNSFALVVGETETVDNSRFREAIRQISAPFISAALENIQSAATTAEDHSKTDARSEDQRGD